jgi:hypothetical protein
MKRSAAAAIRRNRSHLENATDAPSAPNYHPLDPHHDRIPHKIHLHASAARKNFSSSLTRQVWANKRGAKRNLQKRRSKRKSQRGARAAMLFNRNALKPLATVPDKRS